eukprot:augustus_masked-scaffold_6-processed-gene-2.44-mRNA-1 protein AED:0.30 eAED:0.33 QI:0/-1/0/1/-1/1/1/0/565
MTQPYTSEVLFCFYLFVETLSKDAGIIPRVAKELIEQVSTHQESCEIFCSFLQVYNEGLYDLIRDPELKHPLTLQQKSIEDPDEVIVAGLSEYLITSLADMLALVEKGDAQRASRSTKLNEVSSRSHSILTITLEKRTNYGVITSRMNLVDLAGSEKWGVLDQLNKEHVREMNKINTSLHTLGRCIQLLSSTSNNKEVHIPFRDSKLTRILKESINGNCKTVIIATISPSRTSFNETVSTIKFADRARNVILNSTVNIKKPENDEQEVQLLRKEVSHLKKQIQNMETQKNNICMDGLNEQKLIPHLNLEKNPSAAHETFLTEKNLVDDEETDYYKGMVDTLERQLLIHSEQLAVVTTENEKLKAAGASSSAKVSLIELRKLKRENAFLKDSLCKVGTLCKRFFKFEIEEDFLKKETEEILLKVEKRDSNQFSLEKKLELCDLTQNKSFSGRRSSRKVDRRYLDKPPVQTPLSLAGVKGERKLSPNKDERDAKKQIAKRLKSKQQDLLTNKKLREWFSKKAGTKPKRLRESLERIHLKTKDENTSSNTQEKESQLPPVRFPSKHDI